MLPLLTMVFCVLSAVIQIAALVKNYRDFMRKKSLEDEIENGHNGGDQRGNHTN